VRPKRSPCRRTPNRPRRDSQPKQTTPPERLLRNPRHLTPAESKWLEEKTWPSPAFFTGLTPYRPPVAVNAGSPWPAKRDSDKLS
jgi:hypothetical protein